MRPVTYRKLTHAMETKVTDSFGNGRERSCLIEYDGIVLFHLTIPKIHQGDVTPGMLRAIQSDLELPDGEFEDLCACPFTRENFQSHMRRIVLSRNEPSLPDQVTGSVLDGDSRVPYEGFDLGRTRFVWARGSGVLFRVLEVRMLANPERQWNELVPDLTLEDARDEAASRYFKALAADQGD